MQEAPARITGACNQCGNCCLVGEFKCTNLIAAGHIGEPMATRCLLYDRRTPDMPIILTRNDGAWIIGRCIHSTEDETDKLARLIGQGKCSMEVSHG